MSTFVVHLDDLWDAAYKADIDPDRDLRTNYSGRGMYGRECVGIVGFVEDLVSFVIEMSDLSPDAFAWLPSVKSDNMGKRTIFYWPNVQVGEEGD